jgi:hypothetical protein
MSESNYTKNIIVDALVTLSRCDGELKVYENTPTVQKKISDLELRGGKKKQTAEKELSARLKVVRPGLPANPLLNSSNEKSSGERDYASTIEALLNKDEGKLIPDDLDFESYINEKLDPKL